jgi:Rhodopirellula transposase DDE domain
MITAHGGGCNGSRASHWKAEFQKLADETGLTIGQYPPCASTWKID